MCYTPRGKHHPRFRRERGTFKTSFDFASASEKDITRIGLDGVFSFFAGCAVAGYTVYTSPRPPPSPGELDDATDII